MKRKKRILMIPIMVLVFFAAIAVVNAVTIDEEGPVLRSIAIEESNYVAGDKVYIDLDVYDEVSGVSSVTLTYINKTTLDNDFGGLYVYDIDLINPYIKLPDNIASGEYVLKSVVLIDNAGNSSQYYIDDEEYITSFFNDSMIKMEWDMDITIEDNGTDTEAPVLKSLEFNKNTLGVGEKLIITAEIDDESGIREAVAEFGGVWVNLEYKDGVYVGEYVIPEISAAELNLRIFAIIDNVGNSTRYQTEKCDILTVDPIPCTLNDFIEDGVVVITDAVDDSTPPILNGIELNKTTVAAPAFIEVSVDATDDLSGIAYVIIDIAQKDDYTSEKSYWLSYNEETNKYEGTIDIDQYTSSGTYVINGLRLIDNYQNVIDYYTSDYCDFAKEEYNWECTDEEYNGSYTKMDEVSFEVTEATIIGEVTSTISSELISKIENASDGSNIMIDATNSSTIPIEVFEAIQGTSKSIYIESNGIQWIFNGEDITNPKQIYVNTTAEIVDSEGTSGMLEKAILLSFEENGELPGKALIRVKADYTFKDYIGIEDLFVYYLNDSDDLLDRVAEKIDMTEDGYYEFYITHNSDYAITNEQAEEEYVSDNVVSLALNDANVVLDTGVVGEPIKEIIVISSITLVTLTTLIFIFRKKIFKKKYSNN